MTEHTFRFGVVAGQVVSPEQWHAFARRVEDAGFATLLLPDTVNVPAPFSALASAASVTTRLRLGTFVIAAPLRPAAAIAWESASLDRLSDGRFELGLGTGRPDAAKEAELFGLPFGSPGERVEALSATLATLRAKFASEAPSGPFARINYLAPVQQPHPPILIAAGGPRMLKLAAREADIVSIALPPVSTEAQVAAKIAELREYAGDRFDDIELCFTTAAVGADTVPDWMTQRFGIDRAALADNSRLAFLNGSPTELADLLQRRRDELGISYLTIGQDAFERLAPVVELLAGK